MKTVIPILGIITAVTIAVMTEGDIGIARVLLLLLALMLLLFLMITVARRPADQKKV